MRNPKKLVVVPLLALVVVLAAACSPPQEALDAARAALAEGQALEPERYAPEAWQQAQQAMAAVDSELETQAGKFALFRSYKTTGELIAQAQEAAATARSAATEARQQAQAEAQAALGGAQAALDSAQALIGELQQCRRKPKGFAADMELMTGRIDGLRAQLPEVETMVTDQDFLGAASRAAALQTEAESLATELAEAKTKLGC